MHQRLRPPDPADNLVKLDEPEKRRPGRPRSIRRAPTEAERVQQDRVRERLRQHVEADPVVAVTTGAAVDRTSTDALDSVMMQIAVEASGLGFDRERAVVEGRREAERIASRRIAALAKLGELALLRARAGVEERIDPRDPKVQKIVAGFLESMRVCAHEALPHEVAEAFLRVFDAKAQDWEMKVEP